MSRDCHFAERPHKVAGRDPWDYATDYDAVTCEWCLYRAKAHADKYKDAFSWRRIHTRLILLGLQQNLKT